MLSEEERRERRMRKILERAAIKEVQDTQLRKSEDPISIAKSVMRQQSNHDINTGEKKETLDKGVTPEDDIKKMSLTQQKVSEIQSKQKQESTPLVSPSENTPQISAFQLYRASKQSQKTQKSYLLCSKLLGAAVALLVTRKTSGWLVYTMLIIGVFVLSYLHKMAAKLAPVAPSADIPFLSNLLDHQTITKILNIFSLIPYVRLWLNILASYTLVAIMKVQIGIL